MMQILKVFLGIVFGLLLIYIVIIIFRAVFLTGVSTVSTVSNDVSPAKNVVTTAKRFSWQDFVNYWRLPIAPVTIVPNITSSVYYSTQEEQNYKYQNLNNADSPDNHPTDWAPVDQRPFDERWGLQNKNQNYQQNFNGNLYENLPVQKYFNHNFPQLKLLFPSRALMYPNYQNY